MTSTVRAHSGIAFAAARVGVHQLPARTLRVERDLRIPMRDGTALLANRWAPVDNPHAPLVLIRTPYGRGSLQGLLFGRILAHQGLQVLMQSCRGTAGSGGSFDRPFEIEVDDGHDTVAWLSDQAWYPGSFATFGGSYFGYTQLALAHAAPDQHRAAVLAATPNTVREIAWPDDTFSPGMALRWAAQVSHDPTAFVHHTLHASRLAKALSAAAAESPLLTKYQKATSKPVPFLEDWLLHPAADDPLWKSLDLTSNIDALGGPVLIQAGWYDIFLESSLAQYTRLRHRNVDVRLTVGPWNHPGVSQHGNGDAVEFLTEVLLDGPPRAGGRRVRLFDIGPDGTEHRFDDWPTAADREVLYLASGRLLSTPTPGTAASTSYRYDPADPTPQVGGSVLDAKGSGAQDNRRLEARPDVVTFDSEPAATRRTIRGNVSVELDFGSDRPATTVFLRLCIVDPDGVSTNVTDRMVPLAAHDGDTWHIRVELPAVSAVLDAGHRLRLQVSSGAAPRFLPHSGTDEPQTTAAVRFPAQQTVHHSDAMPAIVTVPFAAVEAASLA